MSTANFRQIEHDIPLYVLDDSELDELERYDIAQAIFEDVEELNQSLDLFMVQTKSGYYFGLQLIACVNFFGYEYSAEELDEFDDEDIPWYTACENKQEFMELYDKDLQTIREGFKRIADNYGMTQIRRICVFSNGEAIYEEVK